MYESEKFIEDNLKKIISYISKASAKNATLIAFSEFMMFYTNSSQTPKQLANLAETISENFVTTIAETDSIVAIR